MLLENIITSLSTFFFIAAIIFSFKLSRETGGEKYWVFFLISAIAFGIAHLVRQVPNFFLGNNVFLIAESSEIIGAFSLAYACYGLWTSMKKIRETVGKELDN